MADFKASIKDGEIVFDGPDDKVELFAQFIDEMDEATDATQCDCSSNDKVREVVGNYFPDYVDEVMALFEDNSGFCDCEIGNNAMAQNSVIRKLGSYMDKQEV